MLHKRTQFAALNNIAAKVRGWISFDSKTHGMSLVEVLIAAGVGSALLMGVMQSNMLARKNSRNVALGNDWSSLLTLMRQVYSNQNQCTNMFKNLSVSGANVDGVNVPINVSLTDLGIKSATNVWMSKFLTVGENKNGIVARSISLKSITGNVTKKATDPFYPGQVIYVDQVYLNIQATKVTGAFNGDAASAPISLISGATSSSPDAISFTLYRLKQGVTLGSVIGCSMSLDSAQQSCESMDGDAVFLSSPDSTPSPDGTAHKDHAHKKCSVRTLAINPRRDLTDSVITFGETAGNDQIVANAVQHSLTLKVNNVPALAITNTGSPIISLPGGSTVVQGDLEADSATFDQGANFKGMVTAGSASSSGPLSVDGTISLTGKGETGGNVPHDCYVKSFDNGPTTFPSVQNCGSNEYATGHGLLCKGPNPHAILYAYPDNGSIGSTTACFDLIERHLSFNYTAYVICCPY